MRWPDGERLWACGDPRQRENAERAAAALGTPLGAKACLPTDHVGLLVTVNVLEPESASSVPTPDGASGTGWQPVVALAALLALIVATWRLLRRRGSTSGAH